MTAYLAVLALGAVWVISLLVHPFGKCWRCGGRGNIVRKGRRTAPKCRVCKGKRRRQRLGAKTVHRMRRQVAAHWRAPEGGGQR
jgi:hypothetical protein